MVENKFQPFSKLDGIAFFLIFGFVLIVYFFEGGVVIDRYSVGSKYFHIMRKFPEAPMNVSFSLYYSSLTAEYLQIIFCAYAIVKFGVKYIAKDLKK